MSKVVTSGWVQPPPASNISIEQYLALETEILELLLWEWRRIDAITAHRPMMDPAGINLFNKAAFVMARLESNMKNFGLEWFSLGTDAQMETQARLAKISERLAEMHLDFHGIWDAWRNQITKRFR